MIRNNKLIFADVISVFNIGVYVYPTSLPRHCSNSVRHISSIHFLINYSSLDLNRHWLRYFGAVDLVLFSIFAL